MKRTTGLATTLVLLSAAAIGPQATATETAPSTPTSPSTTLNELARDVSRVESLREVKDVQRTYAQLAQAGRWDEMADLFATDGTLLWGEEEAVGHDAIEDWLEADAGAMDGVRPGSLHTLIIDQPLVTLAVDGDSAKGRWEGIRFMGDGQGQTRIDGGIFENEYVLEDGEWKISLLHFYPLYEGDYDAGFTTIDGEPAPVVPYHFTPDEAGVPIPEPVGAAPPTREHPKDVADRIDRLNAEDSVRNLQHTFGYYVDQRMWTDVADLFTKGSKVTIDGIGTFHGPSGARDAMEQRMGPEGLVQGVLNDRLLFDTIVEVSPNGKHAVTRGIEMGFLDGDDGAGWEFSVFHNRFVKEDGLWRVKEMHISPLMAATYDEGWGDGGTSAAPDSVLPFLDVAGRTPAAPPGNAHGVPNGDTEDLADLERRLSRSVAFDGAENVSAAYSYFIDDSRWPEMTAVHAQNGHKLSPFAGWNVGHDRILGSVRATYGDNPPPTLRSFLVLHWRPQPVVNVSHDGRSADYRSRMLHVISSTTRPGYFNGGMYNDQMVLEDGIWRLWSLNIEEFYWQSANWADGWGAAEPRDPNLPDPPPSNLVNIFPPDVLHSELGERSRGFRGGSPGYIQWPDIVPMWFHYRNPVSGRTPPNYWPNCAPCQVRPDWSMTEYGYQLPPTGPQEDGLPLD